MSKSTNNLPTQEPIFAAIQSGNLQIIERLLSRNDIDLTVQTTTPLEIKGRVTMENTHLTPFSALCVLYKYCPDNYNEILDAFHQMSDIFLKSGRYTDPVDSQGCTEFMWAVWTGNLDLIKKSHDLIKHCNNDYTFNQQDKIGRTALHVAVQNNVEKGIIEYLIKNVEVKVDLRDYQGMTALFYAALAQGGDLKLHPKLNLVDELLENGANPNIPLRSGKLLLSTLCEYIWKLKQGCLNPNNSPSKKVEYVTDITKYAPIVKDLVAKIIQSNKFDPAAKDAGTGFSAVHWVCELGAEKASTLLQKLQELKVDINNGDASGRPTLNWYSDYNIHPIVTKLLELGANVNTQANNGETAPHALLLNANKINSGKPKLPTLELLLSHNNEPPYNPALKMQGATAQDLLNSMINRDDNTNILPDLMACHTLFENYNKWYDETIALPILGAALDNFDLYA